MQILPTGLFILGLSLFLDLLELSFSRILWFIRTLRFWLYFFLHFGISCLAAYLLHSKVTEWYLLAPAGTFLGVSVISNTNIKIGGQSLVPIADLFQSIRAKMLEQAASDKVEKEADEAKRADLARRLRNLALPELENIYRDIMIAAGKVKQGQNLLAQERQRSAGNEDSNKAAVIGHILKANEKYIEDHIDQWDPPQGGNAPAVHANPAPNVAPPPPPAPPAVPPVGP